MKPQTESVNCTANPLHQCTAKLRYKEWTGGCNESRAGKDYIWPHRDNQRTANKDVTLKTGRNLNLPGQFHLWFWPFWNEHHRATFNHRFTNVLYSISRWKNCWHCHLQSDFEMVEKKYEKHFREAVQHSAGRSVLVLILKKRRKIQGYFELDKELQ